MINYSITSHVRKWTNEQWDNATLNDLAEAITGELLGGKNIENKGSESKLAQQQKDLGVSFHLLDKSDFNADGTVKQSVMDAIAKEEADIISRAKADGTYHKAPNGKPSNLNEKQWVQVRTQRFKDWFGDWEIDADLLHLFQNNKFDYEKLKNVARRIQAERARVNGETEAVSREGNGTSSRNDEASLIAEAKRRAERQTKISYEARTWAEHKENVRGQEQALEEYAKREGIWFDDYSVFEYEYGEYDQGIESDVWYDKDSDTHLIKTFGYDFARQVDPYTAIKNRIELHNKLSPFTAYEIIGFTKDQNGNFRFVLKQPFIEGGEVSSADLISFMKEQFDAVPVNKDATEFKSDLYTFKDLHAGNVIKVGNDIHIIDPQISKNEIESESNVSKVVDSNGEPMVVYHGTDAEFNEFYYALNGYYFSKNNTYAEHLAKEIKGLDNVRIMPVFLNIRKPKHFETDVDSYRVGRYLNTKKYLDELPDGIFGKDASEIDNRPGSEDVYIAFSPNQIKSATDNVGTFSETTGDIRYQKGLGANQTRLDFDSAEKTDNEAKKKLRTFANGEPITNTNGDEKFTKDSETEFFTDSKGNVIPFKRFSPNASKTTDNVLQREGYSQQSNDFALVERQFTKDKNFTFRAGPEIKNVNDVAWLFRALEDESIEQVFAVYVKHDGSYVVHHVSQGIFTTSVIDPKIVIGNTVKMDAKQVFFVHNHPSGTLKSSNADNNIHRRLKDGFAGTGITVGDGIIINLRTGKYATFGSDGDLVMSRETQKQEQGNVEVLNFNKQVFIENYNPDKITSTDDVARLLSTKRYGVSVPERTVSISISISLSVRRPSSERSAVRRLSHKLLRLLNHFFISTEKRNALMQFGGLDFKNSSKTVTGFSSRLFC